MNLGGSAGKAAGRGGSPLERGVRPQCCRARAAGARQACPQAAPSGHSGPFSNGMKHGRPRRRRPRSARPARTLLPGARASLRRATVGELPAVGWAAHGDRASRCVGVGRQREVFGSAGDAPVTASPRAQRAEQRRSNKGRKTTGAPNLRPNVRAKLPAEAGVVSPVRDNSTAGADRAYNACRSGSA
jgi:hypothetical protein